MHSFPYLCIAIIFITLFITDFRLSHGWMLISFKALLYGANVFAVTWGSVLLIHNLPTQSAMKMKLSEAIKVTQGGARYVCGLTTVALNRLNHIYTFVVNPLRYFYWLTSKHPVEPLNLYS